MFKIVFVMYGSKHALTHTTQLSKIHIKYYSGLISFPDHELSVLAEFVDRKAAAEVQERDRRLHVSGTF